MSNKVDLILEGLNEARSKGLPDGVGDVVKYKGHLYHRGETDIMGNVTIYGIDTKDNRKVPDDGCLQFVKKDYEWGHGYYYGY